MTIVDVLNGSLTLIKLLLTFTSHQILKGVLYVYIIIIIIVIITP